MKKNAAPQKTRPSGRGTRKIAARKTEARKQEKAVFESC
jgi:hypothetical protein